MPSSSPDCFGRALSSFLFQVAEVSAGALSDFAQLHGKLNIVQIIWAAGDEKLKHSRNVADAVRGI